MREKWGTHNHFSITKLPNYNPYESLKSIITGADRNQLVL